MSDLENIGGSGQGSSDWVEWAGGECPVPGDTEVEVWLRNRHRAHNIAEVFDWFHREDESEFDIIAYRIVSPTLPAVLS